MPNQEKDDKVRRVWTEFKRIKPGDPEPAPTQKWPKVKRVKPLGENIFGTKKVEAEGPKKLRPGDENSTSADFEKASKTANEEKRERYQKRDSFLSEARKKLIDRGWMTSHERMLLDQLERKKRGENI